MIVNPEAKVTIIQFTGIVDILTDIGGLFSSLRIIIVASLSLIIYKQYNKAIAKRIKKI